MRRSLAIVLLTLGCSSGETSAEEPHDAADVGFETTIEASTDSMIFETDPLPTHPLPALPLRTSGRYVVDAKGKRFKLVSVSWYGADEKDYVPAGLELQPIASIATKVREMGFNSVRLPWSNELYEKDPIVADSVVAANPSLKGKHAMEVLDAVIAALAKEGVVVVLDNHVSTADWCCSNGDGNELWYNADYPEEKWLADWKGITKRYLSQPAVVGAELRNELRGAAKWGGGDPKTDWAAAAERGGEAVLSVNPDQLIVVQGINYSNDLGGVYSRPIKLSVANRIVYAPHDYAWDHPANQPYASYKTDLGNAWGFILVQEKAYTAPIWVSEFGTCNGDPSCISGTSGQGLWFSGMLQYLAEADIDWCYWPLNGTQARGTGRTFGAGEGYGVLDPTWTKPSLPQLLDALKAIQPKVEGP